MFIVFYQIVVCIGTSYQKRYNYEVLDVRNLKKKVFLFSYFESWG